MTSLSSAMTSLTHLLWPPLPQYCKYCNITNPFTMTSIPLLLWRHDVANLSAIPLYYDVATPLWLLLWCYTMTSNPLYYDGTCPYTFWSSTVQNLLAMANSQMALTVAVPCCTKTRSWSKKWQDHVFDGGNENIFDYLKKNRYKDIIVFNFKTLVQCYDLSLLNNKLYLLFSRPILPSLTPDTNSFTNIPLAPPTNYV